jgi:hypothetical protein
MFPRPLLTGTAILLCSIAVASARADQTDAFNATISDSWLHDDNLFRLSDGVTIPSSRSDNIHTLGFVGTFDKTISLQKLHAQVSIQDSHYESHSFLNNQPYSANLSWFWALGHNFTGQLSHSGTRNISSFETLQREVKDVYTTGTDSASIRYRVHPDWFVGAATQIYNATHSLSSYSTSNVDVRENRVVLEHIRPNGDEFQLRWIRRDGDYPNHVGGINYAFEERQLDAVVTMAFTGASSVTGSFGRLQRRNPYMPERDYSGQIGRLAWNWLPTGKLSLTASIERSLGAKEDILSTFALTDTLHLGATWAATEKIQLQAGLDRWRSDFRGDPGIVPAGIIPQRKDDGSTLNLGASYELIRNLIASMQLTWSRRDSNYSGIQFRDETAWLNLQFNF